MLRNKLNRNHRITATALAALGAIGPAAASAPAGSQQAAAGLTAIQTHFEDGKKSIRLRQHRDVKLTCMNLVFQDWTSSYLEIMAATPIPKNDVKVLDEFGERYANSLEDLDILESQRKEIQRVTRQAIDKARAEGRWPAPPSDQAGMALSDVKSDALISNLSLCNGADFAKGVDSGLPPLDPTGVIPGDQLNQRLYKIVWNQAPNGGIVATVQEAQPGERSLRFVAGELYRIDTIHRMMIRPGG